MLINWLAPVTGTFFFVNFCAGCLVCESCYQGSKSKCPLCRSRMAKTISLLATTIIENIGHRCKFETKGCNLRMQLDQVDYHKNRCSFRPVHCPSHLCEEKVAYKNVVDHILSQCTFAFAKSNACAISGNVTEVFNRPRNSFHLAKTKVKPIKWNDHFLFLNIEKLNVKNEIENHYFNRL